MPGDQQIKCPACHRSLTRRFTWRGLLWAILCFPCGMFCCMRRKKMRCSGCESEVIVGDGSIPTLAHAYKTLKESKWQFPKNQRQTRGQSQRRTSQIQAAGPERQQGNDAQNYQVISSV